MNPIAVPFAIVLAASLIISGGTAYSQQASADRSPGPDRWTSHQMNQPPPTPKNRYKISSDRMDEIRELYMSAKKELEKKGKKAVK